MKGGQTSPSLVEFIDLYPTIADFCGLKIPHATPGTSLRPVLADPTAGVKDAAFTLVTRGPRLHGQSIRTTRWRCIQWSDGPTELYDHDADPEELHNVAAKHPGIVKELSGKIRSLPGLQP